MKEKTRQFLNTKQFHIILISIIIFIIIFITGVITLKYSVEGEGNPPFTISKISIISIVEGIDNKEDTENKWNLSVNQDNDIYLYIKKNQDHQKTETIQNIVIDNFNIKENPKIGELKLIKPDSNSSNAIFKNAEENEVDKIEFVGETNDGNIKEQTIGNQGGLVTFRYVVFNIGNYISNEEEEINHSLLLQKLAINNEDLKFTVTFDISIKLDSGKTYKSNVKLDLPINNIVDNGIQSMEYEKVEDIIFKRT